MGTPVPQKAAYWANMVEWAGYLNDWMIANNHPAGDGGLANTYYDGQNCAYRLADYLVTPNAVVNNFIQEGFDAYTTYYVRPANGSVQGFRNFTDGELQDVLRSTSRATSALTALQLQLVNGSYVATGDVSDSLLSRECAYALLTHIHAAQAGITLSPTQITRRETLKANALEHINQWAVAFTAPYFRPFMGALTCRALIEYYTYVNADSTILTSVKTISDYAWSSCWKATAGAWGQGNSFLYTDRTGFDPLDAFTQPDLNMLIAPSWGWLFSKSQGASYRTNGDLIFQGGISVYDGPFYSSGAYLGTRSSSNPSGKQYDQQLYWGPQYITWAEGAASMTLSPTVPLLTNTVGETVVATGTGTAWDNSTVFSVSGVTGVSITGKIINSPTSATITMNIGANTGTATISDGSISANVTISAAPPTTGVNARRRPY